MMDLDLSCSSCSSLTGHSYWMPLLDPVASDGINGLSLTAPQEVPGFAGFAQCA